MTDDEFKEVQKKVQVMGNIDHHLSDLEPYLSGFMSDDQQSAQFKVIHRAAQLVDPKKAEVYNNEEKTLIELYTLDEMREIEKHVMDATDLSIEELVSILSPS